MCASVSVLCWYLLQLLWGKLLEALQFVETLAMAVMVAEEVSGTGLQQVEH